MTTYAVNLSGASTQFANYGFDSFCHGPDGKYYGIKADGLYLLEGTTDEGVEIPWSAGQGRIGFGSNALKMMPNAYASIASANPTELVVSGEAGEYVYESRSSSEHLKTQRYDLGKGLRENYYDLTLRGVGSATLDAFEVVEINSKRRIQS